MGEAAQEIKVGSESAPSFSQKSEWRNEEFQTSSSSSFEFEFELARTFIYLFKSISVE